MIVASNIRMLMTSDTVGGVWTYSCSLASTLAASGADVHLVTLGPRPREDQRSMLRDIVHLNSFREATLPWRSPTVVVAHSCVNSWGRACRDSAWLSEPKWQVYTRHVAAGLNTAQSWVAPSQSFHDCIVDIYNPLSPGTVIWNGVAPSSAPHGKQAFIFAAGRLWDRAKNVEALAQAAPGLPWPVLIAGPADDTRVEGMTFLGRLPHDAVRARLHRAAIFVSPAMYEPFGLSVLEAASAGCALVLSDIPSFRELWDDAAVFVDPRNIDELRGELERLCDDSARRERMQQAAYQRSLAYSITSMRDAYLRLYGGLLASTSSADKRQKVPA
jgi:glycosyltransferase involved in cell wall biosynthesis